MEINTKYLYELLPAYYRVVDEEQGNPLKDFIGLLAREGGIVEDNISQLYENWFIETCDEWVVPYIGDLLGVESIHEIEDTTVYSRRAYIANTLAYRRRKGTAPILEQIALDITGWRAKVVEFFQLLSTSQNLNHLRLHNTASPNLRQMNALDLINTAFDKQSHTVDVRRIGTGEGLYNIMNIGLYLWRLISYPMERADARLIPAGPNIPAAAYTFNQIGLDAYLFNNPQTEKDIVHLAEEINVPGLLRRRQLHDELESIRQALVNGKNPNYLYFEETYPPVFQIFINGNQTPIPPEEIVICNLSEWHLPVSSKDYIKYETDGSVSTVARAITAAVDPVLGRISFSDPAAISEVSVDYSYGFSGDLGGGPYDRKSSLMELEEIDFDWQVGVSKDKLSVQGETIHTELWKAIEEWNNLVGEQTGLICIMDNRTFPEDIVGPLRIRLPEGKRLFIIAADWPVKEKSGQKFRSVGTFNPEDLRPHVLGNIEIEGTAAAGSPNGGSLRMNGLLLEGKLKILNGNLSSCQIDHSCLVPNLKGISVAPQSSLFNLQLNRSICGPIDVKGIDTTLCIEECIIDNNEDIAISILKGQLAIEKSTIYGKVEAQSLDASNSLFMDVLTIDRRQIGCVRFSYLPEGSKTPRRYRCQPELEIQQQIKSKEEINILTPIEKQKIKAQVMAWLFPVFNAKTYGHHAYAQLGNASPNQITTGADNGSEMGAFNFLQQAQREANLKNVLKEYLRLGLEAGIIYIT